MLFASSNTAFLYGMGLNIYIYIYIYMYIYFSANVYNIYTYIYIINSERYDEHSSSVLVSCISKVVVAFVSTNQHDPSFQGSELKSFMEWISKNKDILCNCCICNGKFSNDRMGRLESQVGSLVQDVTFMKGSIELMLSAFGLPTSRNPTMIKMTLNTSKP
jgi:hypothetical protein